MPPFYKQNSIESRSLKFEQAGRHSSLFTLHFSLAIRHSPSATRHTLERTIARTSSGSVGVADDTDAGRLERTFPSVASLRNWHHILVLAAFDDNVSRASLKCAISIFNWRVRRARLDGAGSLGPDEHEAGA